MLWAGASGLAVGSLGQPGRTVCECVCLLMKYGKTSREPFLCIGAIICKEAPLSNEYDTEILAFIEAAFKHQPCLIFTSHLSWFPDVVGADVMKRERGRKNVTCK